MGKRSTEIGILGISRDGKLKEKDELVHEGEVVVKLNGEIHKFYCIPVDLKEMIAGNLKSRGIDPSLSRIKKLGSNEFEVNVPEALVKTPMNCDSKKQLTKSEVFDLIEALNENSYLYQKTGCTHVIGICGDRKIFVEDVSRH
jgi:formate dehydrogenase assembly factor FdhD